LPLERQESHGSKIKRYTLGCWPLAVGYLQKQQQKAKSKQLKAQTDLYFEYRVAEIRKGDSVFLLLVKQGSEWKAERLLIAYFSRNRWLLL
jgi:hypothetical protein